MKILRFCGAALFALSVTVFIPGTMLAANEMRNKIDCNQDCPTSCCEAIGFICACACAMDGSAHCGCLFEM